MLNNIQPAYAGVLCVEVCQVLLAPLTLEVEQQHVAALAEFFAAAAEPLRPPAGASDQGAPQAACNRYPHYNAVRWRLTTNDWKLLTPGREILCC